MAQTLPSEPRPSFGDLHAFRGFAVAAIVAAHATYPFLEASGAEDLRTPGRVAVIAIVETLAHDSTLFFALISGLLYSMVLRGRSWASFFRAKALNVVLPYLCVSLLYVLFKHQLTSGWEGTTPGELLKEWIQGLPTGAASFHLWYMPILFLLFAATPLVAALVQARAGWPILLLIVLAPLAVSRVWGHWTWATPTYFLGAYAAGVWAGAHYGAVLEWLARRHAALWLAIALTSPVLLTLYGLDVGDDGPINVRETLFYVQKAAIAGLVLLALRQVAANPPRILMRLGDYAFPIYFLHVFLMDLLLAALSTWHAGPLPDWAVAFGTVVSYPLVLAGALLLARTVELLLGPAARFVIGSQRPHRPRAS